MTKNEILIGLAGGLVFAVTWILVSGFEDILEAIIGGVFFFLAWVVASSIKGKKR